MGIEELDRMSPRMREKYLEAVRGIPPSRKLKQVFEYSDLIRGLTIAGIRAERPGITDEELLDELRIRVLPRELRERAYGK